jgi:hypothetical protein
MTGGIIVIEVIFATPHRQQIESSLDYSSLIALIREALPGVNA